MLFCKRVLVAREKLPRCFRAKNNSFFSTVNAMGVCKNVLFENFYLKKKVLFSLSILQDFLLHDL